ncbi:MAG: toprim domain-containing protein, partial [Blastomonas fulva]
NEGPVMAAGEGIETMLSLRQAMPAVPMIAALSAAHLAALEFPAGLKRLYIACDNDPAGEGAFVKLAGRAADRDNEAIALLPERDDFNSDLMTVGRDALAARMGTMLKPHDVAQYLQPR